MLTRRLTGHTGLYIKYRLISQYSLTNRLVAEFLFKPNYKEDKFPNSTL